MSGGKPDMMTYNEALEGLKLSRQAGDRLRFRNADPMPWVKIGGSIRIPAAALENWIARETDRARRGISL